MDKLCLRIGWVLLAATTISSCAAPRFAVEYNEGRPTIATIVQRIECELVELVKHDNIGSYGYKRFLANPDYVAAMDLTLEVTDTGALTPSINFPNAGSNLAINAGFNFTRTRKHTFTRKLRYSFYQLHKNWAESGGKYGKCPEGNNYDLEGELGIKQMVAMQFSAPQTATSSLVEDKGEFGGSIAFTIEKNVNSAGPTWTLTNFVGPGNLAKVARKSQNKLDIAFAKGAEEFDRSGRPTDTDIRAADAFLRELLILQIDR